MATTIYITQIFNKQPKSCHWSITKYKFKPKNRRDVRVKRLSELREMHQWAGCATLQSTCHHNISISFQSLFRSGLSRPSARWPRSSQLSPRKVGSQAKGLGGQKSWLSEALVYIRNIAILWLLGNPMGTGGLIRIL